MDCTGQWRPGKLKVPSDRWWHGRQKRALSGQPAAPAPFHGYFFRMLTEQGPHATDGARGYIVEGCMTAGFAFLAYPAEYRKTGVMSFIVNQDGELFQKDPVPQSESQ